MKKLVYLLLALFTVCTVSCKKDSGESDNDDKDSGWSLPGYEIQLESATPASMSEVKLSAKATLPETPVEGVVFGIALSNDESFSPGSVSLREFNDVTSSRTLTYNATSLDPAKVYYYTVYYRLGDKTRMVMPKSFVPGAVDMGKGVKWAVVNLGADSKTSSGDYFAWGETEKKQKYLSSNYSYKSTPATLPASADAASVKWGGKWRMPTNAELESLIDPSCSDCQWTTISGVYGLSITSRLVEGAVIFLPAAGFKTGEMLSMNTMAAYYWTSSPHRNPESANEYALNLAALRGSSPVTGNNERYNGLCIRPVWAD